MPGEVQLSDAQIDAIAEKAAEKALKVWHDLQVAEEP